MNRDSKRTPRAHTRHRRVGHDVGDVGDRGQSVETESGLLWQQSDGVGTAADASAR